MSKYLWQRYYGGSASAPSEETVTTTAAEVLAANSGRRMAVLRNTGNVTAYCSYGDEDPTVATAPIAIKAGGVLIETVARTAIRAITESGSTTLAVQEVTL